MVALIVSGCGTFVMYYAIWRGALEPLRGQWRTMPPAQRRHVLIGASASLVLTIVLCAAVIVAPFGRLTVAYVIGGLGAIIVLGIPILAAILAWQNTHPKQ